MLLQSPSLLPLLLLLLLLTSIVLQGSLAVDVAPHTEEAVNVKAICCDKSPACYAEHLSLPLSPGLQGIQHVGSAGVCCPQPSGVPAPFLW
jgi:hypothetical protein